MSIHAELQKCWEFLGRCIGKVDALEAAVRAIEEPAPVVGRDTPFFIQQSVHFSPFDWEEKIIPITVDAQRKTKITRLTAAVTVQFDSEYESGILNQVPLAMKASPYGYVYDRSSFANQQDVDLFDFEWSFTVGSTERRYTDGRGIPRWNARASLGNPESHRQLLFGERHPIVLPPTEMLVFRIRPLLYNMDTTLSYASDNTLFTVHICATAHRVFET